MVQKVPMTAQEILDKQFHKRLFGYNCASVDLFLDEVIKDYVLFRQEIENLMDENETLKRQLLQKRKLVRQLNNSLGAINYDIIKRLSYLEKRVFLKNDRLNTRKDVLRNNHF